MTSTDNAISGWGKALAWLCLAAALAMAGSGYAFNLWSTVVWYDGAVHAFLTFSTTLVVAVYLYGSVLVGAGWRSVVLVGVVALVGLGLGAAWEILELLAELVLFGTGNFQRGDTIADLAFDLGGALVAGITLVVLRGR